MHMRTLLSFISMIMLTSVGFAQGDADRAIFVEPVTMTGYASGVAIEWKTNAEQEVDYYAIIRFSNNREKIVAALEPRALVDTINSYRYIDQSGFSHDLAFKLRTVFIDGSYAESEFLEAKDAHSKRTRILRALDNESLASLRISLDSENDQQVVLQIKTLKGDLLETYNRELTAGVNEIEIDYRGWAEGYYTVELSDTEELLTWLVHVDPAVPVASTRRLPPRS